MSLTETRIKKEMFALDINLLLILSLYLILFWIKSIFDKLYYVDGNWISGKTHLWSSSVRNIHSQISRVSEQTDTRPRPTPSHPLNAELNYSNSFKIKHHHGMKLHQGDKINPAKTNKSFLRDHDPLTRMECSLNDVSEGWWPMALVE